MSQCNAFQLETHIDMSWLSMQHDTHLNAPCHIPTSVRHATLDPVIFYTKKYLPAKDLQLRGSFD